MEPKKTELEKLDQEFLKIQAKRIAFFVKELEMALRSEYLNTPVIQSILSNVKVEVPNWRDSLVFVPDDKAN